MKSVQKRSFLWFVFSRIWTLFHAAHNIGIVISKKISMWPKYLKLFQMTLRTLSLWDTISHVDDWQIPSYLLLHLKMIMSQVVWPIIYTDIQFHFFFETCLKGLNECNFLILIIQIFSRSLFMMWLFIHVKYMAHYCSQDLFVVGLRCLT